MDETVMLKYLSWLHMAVGCIPCALVLDAFPGHRTVRVHDKAAALEIELIAVPPGMTGECQPLDRGCFGPLKKMSQAAWDDRATSQPDLKWTHLEAAKILEEVWRRLTRETVLHAWRFGGEGETGGPAEQEAEDSESVIHSEYVEDTLDSAPPEALPSDVSDSIAEKLAIARSRGRGQSETSVRDVAACLHDQPVFDPRWNEDRITDFLMSRRAEEQFARVQRKALHVQQLLLEEKLHRSFLFPTGRFHAEKAPSERDFLFGPSKPERDEWTW
jgi:hypothetical protein